MAKKKSFSTPSLFEPESRGGDIANEGFSFQDQYTLSLVPYWLAHDGFSAFIREAIGDTEAQFFAPQHDRWNELVEAKNHLLAPKEFWAEIDRFRAIDQGAKNLYRWFTLACSGISETLKPLVNGLRRIRLPYSFYDASSKVIEDSYSEYVEIIEGMGRSREDADFLFNKVSINHEVGLAQSFGEALFTQAVAEHLPEYESASLRSIKLAYLNIGQLMKSQGIKPISRTSIEMLLHESISESQRPTLRPIHIHTSIDENDRLHPSSMRYDWSIFFGGKSRVYPKQDDWNNFLLKDLSVTHDWLVQNRSVRNIVLTGSRRLSSIFAIGSVFSAVSGFNIGLEHRGILWETNHHASSTTEPYNIEAKFMVGTEQHLIVTIGICRDIVEEVDTFLGKVGLKNAPKLQIYGSEPVVSSDQANLLTGLIKDQINSGLSQQDCNLIHFFYAGPSHLALFVGHRLNATVPVQCYEWTSPNCYVPTCLLNA